MNDKDEVLEERYTRDSEFEYDHLPAGNYYFKLLVDENENGAWDTGDFFQKRQPEKLYIYPSLINVRVLWDFEETWVIPMDSTEEDLDSDESGFTPNEKSSPDVEEDLP